MQEKAAMRITWQWTDFEGLSRDDLYAILKAREEVFVVEQECAYLDVDGRDPVSWHLIGWSGEGEARSVAAYLRIVHPGHRFAEASIGRVLTTAEARGRGLGREMMREALKHFEEVSPGAPIRLSGQEHLQDFYRGFGFETASEVYEEDGIPHVEMLRNG